MCIYWNKFLNCCAKSSDKVPTALVCCLPLTTSAVQGICGASLSDVVDSEGKQTQKVGGGKNYACVRAIMDAAVGELSSRLKKVEGLCPPVPPLWQ